MNDAQIIDPLLQGEVNVKDYSDNLFANKPKKEEKKQVEEDTKPKETEKQTENSDANDDVKSQPNEEVKEDVKEVANEVGKDYDGDGIDSMFDNIDKEKPLSYKTDDIPKSDNIIDDTPKSDIKITKEHADAFAGMITYAVKTFIPPAFVYLSNTISGVREAKIYDNVFLKKKLPEEFYTTYQEDQVSLKKTLSISDEEIEMIKGSFSRYAQYKQIKGVNPQTEFFGSVTLVFGNLIMKSIEEGAKSSARWNKVFEKFDITE